MSSKTRLFLVIIWLLCATWLILAADDPALQNLRASKDNTTESASNSTVEYDAIEEYEEDDLRAKDERGQVDGTLWINRTGDARRLDMNTTTMEDCEIWREYWDTTKDASRSISGAIHDTAEDSPDSWRIITTPDQAEEIGLDPSLLLLYAKIKIYVEEVCGEHNDTYWVNDTASATKFGLKGAAFDKFCRPYKLSFEPSIRELKLKQIALIDDTVAFLANLTAKNAIKRFKPLPAGKILDELDAVSSSSGDSPAIRLRIRRKVVSRAKRDTEKSDTEDTVIELNEQGEEKVVIDNPFTDFYLDLTDYVNPILYLQNNLALLVLGLKRTKLFQRYIEIGLNMKRICQSVTPDVLDESTGEGIDQSVGINIKLMPWLDLSELVYQLTEDTELDNIFDKFNETRTVGGSYVIPLMERVKYDKDTMPAIFIGQVVNVRCGIYVESISNFQSTTMDYNMDIYLRMAWRDPRLMHNYSAPILIKDDEMLEEVWIPDPFFSNAKEAEFHEVTFLNFQLKIFNGGLVYYETRIKLIPSCNLVLCKYPHDLQLCGLMMMSFAYPLDQLRFQWFSDTSRALGKNANVQLPELYINKMLPVACDGERASVNYTCLRTEFYLERATGYHVSSTYVPTTLALMFSWVGVWLPLDMMEGRIGLAITVLLTMSTESAGARANLPSVSYSKAIDVWFGFITGFVFVTLLQTLIVIGFGKRAENLRKWASKKRTIATEQMRVEMMTRANSYHAAGRFVDKVCRFMYPLVYGIFLIYYFFVVTKGKQDDCVDNRVTIT